MSLSILCLAQFSSFLFQCQLVDSRRCLMAKQIKLRREQQRNRAASSHVLSSSEGRLSVDSLSSCDSSESLKCPSSPTQEVIQPIPTRPPTLALILPSPTPSTVSPLMSPVNPNVLLSSMIESNPFLNHSLLTSPFLMNSSNLLTFYSFISQLSAVQSSPS